ncbi:MAG: hypothetical protein R2747_18390 [Pyrinomonadaceae bacterium]
MKRFSFTTFLILICTFCIGALRVAAEAPSENKSQEVSETDGVPVLTKHLPDYENVANRATYILNPTDLRNALGERPVFDLIDFAGGTEAVTARYPAGTLLIVEYTTPQFSVDADNRIKGRLSELNGQPAIFYRRIGNYNAFIFDGTDAGAANQLLDQIKYEKDVRWLGTDPFALKRAERNFVLQTSDLFISTVMIVLIGIGISGFGGIVFGIAFFFVREQKRAAMETFSDAGGMTRLNLDGFTPEVLPERLLEE